VRKELNMIRFLKNIEPWKLKGLRIASIGFLVTISGLIIFLFGLKVIALEAIGFQVIGRVVLYVGFVICFIGFAVHLSVVFKRD
jgi:hypothetical protein